MANTYAPNTKLRKPAAGDRTWNVPVNENVGILDGVNAVGGLLVTTHEQPSSSLLIDVASGLYLNQASSVASYAGVSGAVLTPSVTTSVYLTNAGALTLVTTGFPAAPAVYVPLAVVVTGPSSVSSITDARCALAVAGTANLALSGGTLTDGANIAVGTATGTKIGTGATQKLGFFGKTPVAQPVLGAVTAGSTYGSTEQAILNALVAMARGLGLGS